MVVTASFLGSSAWAGQLCPGSRHALTTPAFAGVSYVDLRLGRAAGAWLVDFGATTTTVSSAVRQPPTPGGFVHLNDLEFPGASTDRRAFRVVAGRPGEPLGTIGTDLLAGVTTEFHFEDATSPYVVFSTAPCDPASPNGNFFRIREPNYFASKPGTGRALPNVPVVFIELQDRSADRTRPATANGRPAGRTWAQIDTGYGDTVWPFSVDINEPYLQQLERRVPSLRQVGHVEVTGCDGERSSRAMYAAPGWTLTIVNEVGEPLPKRFDSVRFIVKPTRTNCGGIGPLTEPAAQLGASFLRAFGTTIFVPATSDVWIVTPEDGASRPPGDPNGTR